MTASRAGTGEGKEHEPRVNAESKESLKHKRWGQVNRTKARTWKGSQCPKLEPVEQPIL